MLNVSGNNTAALPVLLRNSSAIEVQQGTLVLSDSLTTGSAGAYNRLSQAQET